MRSEYEANMAMSESIKAPVWARPAPRRSERPGPSLVSVIRRVFLLDAVGVRG